MLPPDALLESGDLNLEALKAGLRADLPEAVAAMRRELLRLASGQGRIVVGPWLSEVGYEILYWIPFLRWAVAEYGISPDRLTVVSRGAVKSWYRGLANQYVDIFDRITPDEFRVLNEERWASTGVQKHTVVSEFDRLILAKLDLSGEDALLHPSIMYRLFDEYWTGKAGFDRFTDHVILKRMKAPDHKVTALLPEEFTAVKLYSRPSLPLNEENLAFVERYTLQLAERGPVVFLNTNMEVDDHRDFRPPKHPNIIRIQSQLRPQTNLLAQSAIVARAKEVHCTYGGFAYLPLCYGVPAVGVFSHDRHFMKIHGRAAYLLAARTKTPLSVAHATPLHDLALSAARRVKRAARDSASNEADRERMKGDLSSLRRDIETAQRALADQAELAVAVAASHAQEVAALAAKVEALDRENKTLEEELGRRDDKLSASLREKEKLRSDFREAFDARQLLLGKLKDAHKDRTVLLEKLKDSRALLDVVKPLKADLAALKAARKSGQRSASRLARSAEVSGLRAEKAEGRLARALEQAEAMKAELREVRGQLRERQDRASRLRRYLLSLQPRVSSYSEAGAWLEALASAPRAEGPTTTKSTRELHPVQVVEVAAVRLGLGIDPPFDADLTAATGYGRAEATRLRKQAAEKQGTGDLGGAFVDLSMAVALEPGHADLWVAMARVALLQDNFDLALAVSFRALALAPANATAHSVRAEALVASGEPELAALHASAAIELGGVEPISTTAVIARCWRRTEAVGGPGTFDLSAALSAVEARGRWPEAQASLVRGLSDTRSVEIQKQLLRSVREQPERARTAATRIERRPLALISQIQRSGGTLLAQLFDGHPQLAVHPHEMQIGYPAKWDWPSIDMSQPPEVWLDQLFETVLATFLTKGYAKSDGNRSALKVRHPFTFDLPGLVKNFLRLAEAAEAPRAVIDSYLTAFFAAWSDADTSAARWTVGFCPRLIAFEESVTRFFGDYPDGALFSCIRHPVSWFASSMRHTEEYADVDQAIGLWLASTQSALDLARTRPQTVRLTTYDALVTDPERVLRGLCDAMRIDFDPILLTPTYARIPILPNSSFDIASHGIHRQSLDQGDRLSAAQLATIRSVAMPVYEEAMREMKDV